MLGKRLGKTSRKTAVYYIYSAILNQVRRVMARSMDGWGYK